MAAMMAVTAVPANTFAADIEFSDGEAETAEAQEDSADISVEEDTGSAEAQTEDFQAEEPSEEAVTVNEENADFFSRCGRCFIQRWRRGSGRCRW